MSSGSAAPTSPAARRELRRRGLDAEQVRPGPDGRIRLEQVRDHRPPPPDRPPVSSDSAARETRDVRSADAGALVVALQVDASLIEHCLDDDVRIGHLAVAAAARCVAADPAMRDSVTYVSLAGRTIDAAADWRLGRLVDLSGEGKPVADSSDAGIHVSELDVPGATASWRSPRNEAAIEVVVGAARTTVVASMSPSSTLGARRALDVTVSFGSALASEPWVGRLCTGIVERMEQTDWQAEK